MARFDTKNHVLIQTNFTAGVFSPRLRSRVDLTKYVDALEICDNAIILSHGGVIKRPGSRYITGVKNSAHNTRLIPFVFSTTANYILEFGDQYIRVYKDEGQVLDPTSPGTNPYEVPGTIPWTESQVFGITYVQGSTTLYLCHGSHEVRELTRTSDTAWTISEYESGDGPYRPQNATSSLTITPSATTGSVTLTASSALFASTDVGRKVRLSIGGTWGYAKITAFSSSTSVTATVVNTLGGTTATSIWRLGAWSDTTGHPSAWPTFHNNRLCFANTSSDPNWFWMSMSDSFSEHAPSEADGTVTDSSGISRGITDRKVNTIYWLVSDNDSLVAGTTGGPFRVWSGKSTEVLSPNNITSDNQTRDGVAFINPILASDTTIFVSKTKKKLRELVFSFERDKRVSPELSILAEHILKQKVVEMAYQEFPDPLVWIVLEDGSLKCMTYLRDQEVIAFHDHPIGGTDVKIKSVAVIPDDNELFDSVYFVVERTVNSATVRYVEFLEEPFSASDVSDYSDAFYVDSGLTYSGAATTTITGLSHLEGETVKILADGGTHANKVVSSGQITLDRSVTKAHVGLSYISKLKQLPKEVQLQTGTSQGRTKIVTKTVLRFYQSIGGKIGPDENTLEPLIWRDQTMAMDSAPSLFTGDKVVEFNDDYNTDGGLMFYHDDPTPFDLLAIISFIVVEDR